MERCAARLSTATTSARCVTRWSQRSDAFQEPRNAFVVVRPGPLQDVRIRSHRRAVDAPLEAAPRRAVSQCIEVRGRVGNEQVGLIPQQRLGAVLAVRGAEIGGRVAASRELDQLGDVRARPAVQIGPLPSTTKTLGRRAKPRVRFTSAAVSRCRRPMVAAASRPRPVSAPIARRFEKISPYVSSASRQPEGAPAAAAPRSGPAPEFRRWHLGAAPRSLRRRRCRRPRRAAGAAPRARRCTPKPPRAVGRRRSRRRRRQTKGSA